MTRFLFLVFLFALPGFAQFGAPAGQNQGAQANQLPLSGGPPQGGSVAATEAPVAGTTNSVNTINPSIETQGPFAGSALSTRARPFSGKLSFKDAINRALEYNLGAIGLNQAVAQAHGQMLAVRSALLPNVSSSLAETVQQTNLRADGLRFSSPIAGFVIPSIVGPFNYFDLRARLSQTVADLGAIKNYRSSQESVKANQLYAKDARDLVVLAAGGAYLQAVAARARVTSARAQLAAARALYQQTVDQKSAGIVAQIDVNKNQVQMLTQQQRLVTLENDFSKQKINLARVTGLPPNDRYDLSDDVPYADAPVTSEDDAVMQALAQRPDIQASLAQIRAAERALDAARDERMPSLALNADYGVIGTNPSQSHGTFSVTGTLRIPIWQGGKTEGDIEQASAAAAERKAELEDLRSRVESEVRNAYLDLRAAASQVEVAQENLTVNRQTLDLTRQRLEAGVTDTVDVAQQQAAVAQAELDYINSVFAHNVAKLSLARAAGAAEENLSRYLRLP
jgi:outer membrane protein TolC